VGATPEQLDAAADSDDPKAALVALVLAKVVASEPPLLVVEDRSLNDHFTRSTAMKREELSPLSNTQLRARAKLVGASTRQMEEAAYADDVKEVLILLLLDLELPQDASSGHVGNVNACACDAAGAAGSPALVDGSAAAQLPVRMGRPAGHSGAAPAMCVTPAAKFIASSVFCACTQGGMWQNT
jgi:hypothetical protein